jgi:hypothetical protein
MQMIEVTDYGNGANVSIVHLARIGQFQQFLLCDVDLGFLKVMGQ